MIDALDKALPRFPGSFLTIIPGKTDVRADWRLPNMKVVGLNRPSLVETLEAVLEALKTGKHPDAPKRKKVAPKEDWSDVI